MKQIALLFLLTVGLVFDNAVTIAQEIKGTYAIKNVKTGMLLRIKDANGKNGTPLVAYGPQNWKCMTWDFQSAGGNAYQLENLFTKKTFQPAAKAEVSVTLEEQPLVAADPNQQYEFINVKKDTYLIRLKGTELFITPLDEEGSTNSAIILAKKMDKPLQQWIIYKQNPTM
ncbi:RICIN domain-containing protein [Pedobacter sp. PWIIR3]